MRANPLLEDAFLVAVLSRFLHWLVNVDRRERRDTSVPQLALRIVEREISRLINPRFSSETRRGTFQLLSGAFSLAPRRSIRPERQLDRSGLDSFGIFVIRERISARAESRTETARFRRSEADTVVKVVSLAPHAAGIRLISARRAARSAPLCLPWRSLRERYISAARNASG